jgi:hypothetical protein
VVTLARYQEFKRSAEPFTPLGPSYHWLSFQNPDMGTTVRWDDQDDLETVALLVRERVPYLVVMPSTYQVSARSIAQTLPTCS